MENGDSFYTQSLRLTSNGYCVDRIFAFDWNGFDGYEDDAPRLAEFVEEVLAETGSEQVDIVAHSLGAGVGVEYLASLKNFDKIAHYVQVAALPCSEIPKGVPALNISSRDDLIIGVCELENTENRILEGLDHLKTATSEATFLELYRFFNDGLSPETMEILPDDEIFISGRTVEYALNEPVEGVEVQVFEFDPETGERLRDTPDDIFYSDSDGTWGPFQAAPGAYYEFHCLDPYGHWPPLHYYREPFSRSNNMVYLRVYPEPGTALADFFGIASFEEDVAAFSWININQALQYGRDTLTVNGIELATEEVAPPEYTTIVIVFGDINFNGISDATYEGGLVPSRYYVAFFDLLIPTEPREPIVFEFNGRTMAIPNWEARSGGISTAVFQ
jgi:pimeloyl-ACP methyl ester carboxylesterase